MESERRPRIGHFSHRHDLYLTDEEQLELLRPCNMCTQLITSVPYYRCKSGCKFSIHIWCSDVPRYIKNHYFHPQHSLLLTDESSGENTNLFCDVCLRNCSGSFVYRCTGTSGIESDGCPFIIDIKCSLLSQFQRADYFEIDYHPNASLCVRNKNYIYPCSCCSGTFDRLEKPWVSPHTGGLLHGWCLYLPTPRMNHPFHPNHGLTLVRHQRDELTCTACNTRRDGYAYWCNECGFVLDYHCASMKASRIVTYLGIDGEEISEKFSHPHQLVLCDTFVGETPTLPRLCRVCGISLSGSICYCLECNALMHKSCADIPREISEHSLHPQHPLTMGYNFQAYHQKCGACSGPCKGFVYKCSQNCEWYIEARCALPKTQILMPEVHKHDLIFFNERNHQRTCQTCQQPCHFPFFCCPDCDFFIHVHCISTFPSVINYDGHVHLLTLTHTPVKEYEDDDEDTELYCDACETLRKLSHRTYSCRTCHYVAHPHCLLPEIIKIREEELLKQGNDSATGDEEKPMLTFGEFRDSFLPHDENELNTIVKASRACFQGDSEYKDLFPLRLDETLNQILQKLISNEEGELPWSNWEKAAKLVKVGEHIIHDSRATTMAALFDRYGDFSRGSTLGPKVKTYCIMAVCDMVYTMCNTKVTDVTASQLVSWYRCTLLGQCAGFGVKFLLDRLSKVVHAHCARVKSEAAKQHDSMFDSKGHNLIEFTQVNEADAQKQFIKDYEVKNMQLAMKKSDEKIKELKKELERKHRIRKSMDVWAIVAVELKGQMAGADLY